MFRVFYLFILLPFMAPFTGFTQVIPLSADYYDRLDASVKPGTLTYHPSIKPILHQEADSLLNADSVLYPKWKGTKFHGTLIGRKLFSENLIRVNVKDFALTIDPVFDFGVGSETPSNHNFWQNTRGFAIAGRIGNRFVFNTEFYESQAVFPNYLDSITRYSGVIPGLGKPKDFKTGGYDYGFSEGSITYLPSEHFAIRLGQGKNFIGNGYRSLLLSDASFSYPYLSLSATVWRIKYLALYAQFEDLQSPNSYSLGYTKKFGTFHYLDITIGKRINLGIFEAIIWEAADSSGQRGFELAYLNPIIFLRPIEFSLGSPDNALIGLNASYLLGKNWRIYSQLLLDEFKLEHILKNDGWWANKQGVQLGFSGHDVFGQPNLGLRVEFNTVRPYVYSHSNSLQCYGHYNQPLAHPLGANFREILAIANYRRGNWFAETKFSYALYGADTANLNFGGNIFKPYDTFVQEYNNITGQGRKETVVYRDLTIAYLLNPRTNMRLESLFSWRTQSDDQHSMHSLMFSLSFKTKLFTKYTDF